MTGRPAPMAMDDLLRSLAGARFFYVPNTGNAGDGLIACATLQVFARLGLEWVLVRAPEDVPALPAGSSVVIGGGGHMTRYWNGFATLLEALHGRARRIVVLPHTIEGNERLLAQLGPTVDLVCREAVSYAHVAAHARGGCRVHLSHDMAFHLDLASLLASRRPHALEAWRALRGRHGARRAWLVYTTLRRLRAAARGSRMLNCFRADAESAGWPIPEDNIDLSGIFASHDARYDAGDAERSARALVSFVNRFDIVNTDRLHVGIVGALLGKHVRLHVGAYYKIEAVYRLSLEGRFPRVVLVASPRRGAASAARSA